jgi:hypothetical protein
MRITSNQAILRRWIRELYDLPEDLRFNVQKLLGLTTKDAMAEYPSRFQIRRSIEQVENDLNALIEQYERETEGTIRGDFTVRD